MATPRTKTSKPPAPPARPGEARVLPRHRRIGELDDVGLAAADAAAAQRDLELDAEIGALDHDQASQRHDPSVSSAHA